MTLRLIALRPIRTVALVSTAIVTLAALAASLLGDVTFPWLVGISGAQARPAILVTAMLVALPIALVLVSLVMRFREEKQSLVAREGLLLSAQHYANVGYWEYHVASGRFVLPDVVHETLGDPERSLQVTVPVLMGMTHPEDREALAAAIERILSAGTQEQLEYRVTGLDGLEKTFWATGTRLSGSDGRPAKIFGLYQDISARRKALQDLQYLAHHDSPTGLPNRLHFREQLDKQLAHATEEHQAALLLLDLDEFKSVNDTLGHPAGDQLLQQAAARLQSYVRGTDLIARFGGDEFAVLLVEAKGRQEVEGLAQHIIDTLCEPYLLEGQEVVLGASAGIKLVTRPGHCADDVIKKADIALYQAKADGRDVYRFFEPGMEQSAQESQALRADLREALSQGQFALHYQPVVQFATGRVSAFEALLRWHHPCRGLVHPAEFIPMAESTGAITEIGAWALHEACRQAATWPQTISVSVNLSPRQFRGGDIADQVRMALRISGLPAYRLRLEITESLLLQDDAIVYETLDTLRALGTRLSIDDFGTGYSSLGYLRRFAVDNIKIDRSFVADLAENPRTAAILHAVMSLGEDLGVSITAEGVETQIQKQRLQVIGCHEGQGYLFSPPMPARDVDAFLERSHGKGWIHAGGTSHALGASLSRTGLH